MKNTIITKIENKQACLPARRFALGGGLEEPFCKQAVVGVIGLGYDGCLRETGAGKPDRVVALHSCFGYIAVTH